jgi:hypothetical protein
VKNLAKTAASVSAMLLATVGPAAADRLDDVNVRSKLIVGLNETTTPMAHKFKIQPG